MESKNKSDILRFIESYGEPLAAIFTVIVLFYQTFILLPSQSEKLKQQDNKLKMIETQLKKRELFSDRIFQSIDFLVDSDDSEKGKAKAIIALIGLDILAEKDEDRKKIVTLILSSERGVLVEALLKAFGKDPAYKKFLDDPKIKSLLSRPSVQKAATQVATEQDSARDQIETSKLDKGLQTSALAIAAQNVSDGWIYLGHSENLKKDEISNTKTIGLDKPPEKNTIQTMSITTNLRDSSPLKNKKLGNIIGVVEERKKGNYSG